MNEISRDILTIDRIVHNEENLDFSIVEYTLKVKSGLYLTPESDMIASNDYIVTCLIDHLRNLLSNENIRFTIQGSIIEQRHVG